MSSAIRESNEEFEDQFRLQQEAAEREKLAGSQTKKTRVDDDGTVMEWDEEKRAWFPKIDDDFIASYQMNFGVQNEQESAHTAWRQFAAQVEKLKAERGDEDEEVKKAVASLGEYYRSPAYRAWYDEYQKRQKDSKEEERVRLETKHRLQKVVEVSADDALKRAEEEQRLGVPIAKSETEKVKAVQPEGETSSDGHSRKRKKKGAPEWYEITDDKNTHVYVSGLPPTITEAEFTALMSKCGIIMNDPLTDKLRIKLYRDEEGKPKGDGRCCYIKIESVDLALQILDGLQYEPGYILHVERAKFQPKKDFDYTKHRRLTAKEKKKFKQKQENLFKWKPDANKLIRGKKERVIILRGVFDEKDLGLDVSLIPEIRERVRTQCAKVGAIKKIVVYDTNPEGVVSVTFSTPEEADVAVGFLDKALFTYRAPVVEGTGDSGGQRTRQLRVERWDGRERFDKCGESAEAEAERLERWNRFIGEDPDADDGDGDGSEKSGVDDVEATDTDEELEARCGDSGAETE
ncbi:HIV Tat specific factor 1 [Echinococcus multilocularis]|uniref:17S U2 SnRNP complex component HTATSF1 n=1 Tax=Echinococcus multilocularis TaxID=6211 RepID=A0A068YGD6_ECHMU|nr:HIV Tat specific factor 1 [Echinococcus multilocularis]